MELQTLTITAPLLLTMLYNRGLFWPANSFHFMLVLSCTFFVLATCGPCSIDGMKKSAEYDACRSYGGYQGAGLHDVIVGDTNMGYVIRTSVTHLNIENICTSSNSFCFPSTLPGLFSEDHKPRENSLEVSRIQSDDSLPVGSTETRKIASNKTWSSDYGTFGLLNGKTVSCSLNFKERIHELSSIQTDCGDQSDFSSCRGTSLNQHSTNGRLNMKSEMSKPGSFDTSSSPNVEISPPVLDWGHKNLFFPSVAFLTVANSCNDSILHVYEPFSTNAQFYPCNFSEILLEPREVASICFVFLPRWLGLSESQLILQTSSGGFLVSAKGFGIESPYKIQPLMDLDVPSSGRLSKNLSLFNPFDETLQVKEVTAWVSVSLGNTTYQTEANCGVGHFLNSDETNLLSVKDWLVVDSGQVGSLLMAMRPHTNWGIGSRSSESIVEIDFSLGLEGKILGAFCLQLIRSSQNISDTVIVPLEVDLDRRAAYGDLSGPVLVSLQSLVAQDTGGTVVSISLRNRASYMLNLVSISEVADTKLFQIKYMEGLLLFPGTVTEVAVISCTQLPVELHNSFPEVSNMNRNCKLFLLINDSSSPQIEIPCQDIIRVCSRHQKDSTIGYEYKAGSVKSGNARTGSLGDGVKLPSEIENELCQMRLDVSVLDELVREYCVYRGFIDSTLASSSGMQTPSKSLKVNQPESGCSSRNCSLEVDCSTSKHSDGEASISNTNVDASPENNTDVTSMQGTDVELRFAGEPMGSHEDCSTSGSHQPESSKVLRNRGNGTGERNKRKRWRGRHDDFGYVPDVSHNGCDQQVRGSSSKMSKEQQAMENHIIFYYNHKDDKYEILLGMKELASRGMAAEAVEEVNTMDPDFFVQNPVLLFQLKQVEFLKLVSSGDHSAALKVASSHLGPLAARHPDLLKPLKETLLALLRPNDHALVKGFPLFAIATSLQVAIGQRLGIEEPQLMKIIRATLHTHSEWFKLQMCKDRFEGLLRIDSLKEVNTSFLAATAVMSKSNGDSCTQASSQLTTSSNARLSEDGSSPSQVSSGDVVCDENAILKVMEFLDLPRADAIHLLAQYNGNAETVIQQIFA